MLSSDFPSNMIGFIHIILSFLCGFVQPAGFQTLTLADWTSGLQGDQEMPVNKMSNVAKQASCIEFVVSCCHARVSLLSSWYREVVLKGLSPALKKRYPSPLEPLHLLWMKSALLHPSSGATNRCILQLHAPSCLHLGPFVWRRCYSKAGTLAEFKWASAEWSNAGRLAGGSSFHGPSSYCELKY